MLDNIYESSALQKEYGTHFVENEIFTDKEQANGHHPSKNRWDEPRQYYNNQKNNKRPKWFGKGCAEWPPHSEARIEPRDRPIDGQTDGHCEHQ